VHALNTMESAARLPEQIPRRWSSWHNTGRRWYMYQRDAWPQFEVRDVDFSLKLPAVPTPWPSATDSGLQAARHPRASFAAARYRDCLDSTWRYGWSSVAPIEICLSDGKQHRFVPSTDSDVLPTVRARVGSGLARQRRSRGGSVTHQVVCQPASIDRACPRDMWQLWTWVCRIAIGDCRRSSELV
jgi:hypothetical protein